MAKKPKTKIPRALLKKWAEALGSGRFKQGIGHLYDADKKTYCCLGVLCVVAGLKNRGGRFSYKGEGSAGVLPTNFRHEIGISIDTQDTLTRMNDNKRRTFKQIAAYARRYL